MSKQTVSTNNKKNASKPKKNRKQNILIWACISFFVLIITFVIINDSISRNYYVKDLRVIKGTIINRVIDGEKMYFKIQPDSSEPVLFTDDSSWIEVSSDFYNKKNQLAEVGLLAAYYEQYKPKFWGIFGNSGQKLESSFWGIEEIYDSIDAAQQSNPYKKFTDNAELKKKKMTKDNRMFFVVASQDRTFNLEVDQAIYNKCNVGQKLSCEFESLGESTKCLRVVP